MPAEPSTFPPVSGQGRRWDRDAGGDVGDGGNIFDNRGAEFVNAATPAGYRSEDR